MNSKIANNIKKIRKEQGLSQEEFADKLGVSRQSVSKWESGGAYPEMDKVLQICEIFNLNVDELLNQDITDVNEIKESKNRVNKFMDDFLGFFTKTINLFTSMKFKDKLKLLFEEAIIILVLCLIGNLVNEVVYKLLGTLFMQGKILPVIYEIINKIIMCAYGVLALVLTIHTFKTRYLDYYEIVDSKEDEEKEGPNKKDNIIEEKRNEKVIIRDPKHSEYRFVKGLLKCFIFLIKCFAFVLLLNFAFIIICFVACLALSIIYIYINKIFISIALCILASTAIISLFFEGTFDFIFNKRFHAKRIFITFLVSLIALGVGAALTFNYGTNFKFVNKDYELTDTYEETVKYKENMKVNGPSNIYRYIIDESLKDDIRVVLKYNKEVQLTSSSNHDNSLNMFVFDIDFIFFKLYKESLEGLKNNIIYSYNQPFPKIEIYGSSNNIKKLIKESSKATISKLEKEENGYILNIDTEFYYDEAICYLDDFFYNCVDVDGPSKMSDFSYNGETLEYDHDKYKCQHQVNSSYYYCTDKME